MSTSVVYHGPSAATETVYLDVHYTFPQGQSVAVPDALALILFGEGFTAPDGSTPGYVPPSPVVYEQPIVANGVLSKYRAADGTVVALSAGSSGSALTPTAVKTANYTAASGDLVRVDTTSGARTITLPAAAAGATVGVKLVTLGAGNAVTIAAAGSDVFNKAGGATTLTLSLLNQGVVLAATAGVWAVQADDLPLSQLDGRYALASVEPRVSALEVTYPPSATKAWMPQTPTGAALSSDAPTLPHTYAAGNAAFTWASTPAGNYRWTWELVLPAGSDMAVTVYSLHSGSYTTVGNFVIRADTESDYRDVMEFAWPTGDQFVVSFVVPAQGMTLKTMRLEPVAKVGRYTRSETTAGTTASFSGGSIFNLHSPIEPVGGTPMRCVFQWDGVNGESIDDQHLRPAFGSEYVHPESSYFRYYGEDISGGLTTITVGNNDHIFEIWTNHGTDTYVFRGDVHGGESSATLTPATDFVVQYDTFGTGDWRTYVVGKMYRQAARWRVSHATKLRLADSTQLFHFTKRWTIYSDGTMRQDRTSIADMDVPCREWIYWMVSGDPSTHLAKLGFDGTTRAAALPAGAALTTDYVDYFGGNHALMYEPTTGVALDIAVDRPALLAYPHTIRGDNPTPPPLPRVMDGELNGELNKLYLFLRFDTYTIPSGYRIDSTQWHFFYTPADPLYPEIEMAHKAAVPTALPLVYPAA